VENLPWREPHPILHNGYECIKKRLLSLLSRLKKEPGILRGYESVIREQLDRGIVEWVCEEKPSEVGEIHYLSHHLVIRKDKQTAVRILYDYSVKGGGGPSLN